MQAVTAGFSPRVDVRYRRTAALGTRFIVLNLPLSRTVPHPRPKPASKSATRRSAPPLSLEPEAEDDEGALPPGTRLDEFEIIRVLGIGGFGIVYLARDHALLRQVAIKEYMPSELARRRPDLRLSVRRGPHAETFAAGLQSFVKEAQLLARFDHPSLVKVYRYWQGNGTAYMAMQYYEGRTLQQERRTLTAAPSEVWLRGLVYSLLGALDVLHAQGVFHRDISPDNILLLPDGCPVLLDFGAARHIVGNGPQALTAVFKPNFAPIEQCGEIPGLLQGPWTDLYALGAVVHFMLTGHAPMPAMVRAVHDAMPALTAPETGMRGLSSAFLASIDWALGVRPEERPRDAQMLRDALEGIVQAPPVVRKVDGSGAHAHGSIHSDSGLASTSWATTLQATTRLARPESAPTGTTPTSEVGVVDTVGAHPSEVGVLRTVGAVQSQGGIPPNAAAFPSGVGVAATLGALPSGVGEVAPASRVRAPATVRVRSAIGWRSVATGAALALSVAGMTLWGLGASRGWRTPTPAISSAAPSPTPADAGAAVVRPMHVLPPAVAAVTTGVAAGTTPQPDRTPTLGADREPIAKSPVPLSQADSSRLSPPPAAASAVSRDAGVVREASAANDAAAARRRAAPAIAAAPSPAASEPQGDAALAPPARPVRSAVAALRASERGGAAATVSGSPRVACGDRNFVSMAVCMTRECREPAFREHQECREFRRYEEARQQAQSR